VTTPPSTPATRPAIPNAWHKLQLTLDMIKFEHSVFALPFALTAAALAFQVSRQAPRQAAWKLVWIVAAMVAARSAAMAFNRLVDQQIDARNPRTATRHLPAGLLSRSFAWGFTAASIAAFLAACAALNPLCLQLAPVALAVVLGYSFAKRFTSLVHLVLGLALGIAPAAAWIAMTGTLDVRIVWLTAAVMFWTAGFDVIYACLDYDFDRAAGIRSLPARLGLRRALWLSRLMHGLMIVCLAALALSFDRTWPSWTGIAVVAALLIWEHRMVRHDDLSRVNLAFFQVNGYVGICFFVFWAGEALVGGK
jgi:4-hydroxybenzoate polyprenyltransferase